MKQSSPVQADTRWPSL